MVFLFVSCETNSTKPTNPICLTDLKVSRETIVFMVINNGVSRETVYKKRTKFHVKQNMLRKCGLLTGFMLNGYKTTRVPRETLVYFLSS